TLGWLGPAEPFSYKLYDPIATTKADREGRYHFSEVPPGRYWIKPIAAGYINVGGASGFPGRTTAVATGSQVENLDLDLILGGVVSGCVTDEDGQPVIGEAIELIYAGERGIYDDPDLEDDSVETDSAGLYRIVGIPPGDYFIRLGENI